MGGFSLIHWLVLGLIILLLFGGNRFSAMMGDVAKGLRGFKQGLADDPPTEPRRSELTNDKSLDQPGDKRGPFTDPTKAPRSPDRDRQN
jgi:sec-independent protein translocase protein TatA